MNMIVNKHDCITEETLIKKTKLYISAATIEQWRVCLYVCCMYCLHMYMHTVTQPLSLDVVPNLSIRELTEVRDRVCEWILSPQ